MYTGPFIDVDVHHTWASDNEIIEYMPAVWREYVSGPGAGHQLAIKPRTSSIQHPGGVNKRLETFPPSGGPPGSDYETLRRQLLDKYNIERCIIGFDAANNCAVNNPYFAHAITQAINDWNLDRWLSLPDQRIYGVALVPTQLPVEAAKEIRRVGKHPRIVEARLTFNGLSKPFGHPLYDPIFEAAEEMDLPVAMHATGAEQYTGVLTHTAGGRPMTRFEQHTLMIEGSIQHIASLLINGVFEKFPRLKFIAVETGIAWTPWLMWSLDAHFDVLRRESKWVKKLPSEYFREHIRLTTQPLELSPKPEQFVQLMEAFGGVDDLLCFATDYPHWDADSPTYISRRLPQSWHRKVFYENALSVYRWSRLSSAKVGPEPMAASG
jgi:predicted TIM-barrel fold metal-dependent hydrolase